MKGKRLTGRVVSTKMKDTAVILVERYVKHPRYGKYIKIRKKIKAHDPGNSALLGEKVTISESRPISKDKHFVVIQGTK